MSIRRKITEHLQNWSLLENGERGVLLVRGVRQCGKTYVVNEFLRQTFGKKYFGFDLEQMFAAISLLQGRDCGEPLRIFARKSAAAVLQKYVWRKPAL